MRKTDKKIIEYLDGQMDYFQLKEFENELKNSGRLRNTLAEYKKVFDAAGSVKENTIPDGYADSILPEFRRRLEKQNYFKPHFSPAYGAVLAVIVILIILVSLPTDNDQNINPDFVSADDMTVSEIDNLFEQMTTEDMLIEYSNKESVSLDSIYSSFYSTEITEAEDRIENLFVLNDLEYSEIEQLLSEQDLEIVYNEIINKEIY